MITDPASVGSASLTDAGSGEQPGIIEVLRALFDSWRGAAEARLSLIALDLASAAISVGRLIAMAIVIGVIALIAWLISVGLAIVWAVENGFNGYLITLFAIGFHFAAVGSGLVWLNHQRQTLGAQLVRHLSRDMPR